MAESLRQSRSITERRALIQSETHLHTCPHLPETHLHTLETLACQLQLEKYSYTSNNENIQSNTNTQIHLQKSIMKAFSQTQRGIVKCNLLDIETLPLLFKPRKSFQLKFCQIVLLRRKTLSEANVIMDSFGELAKISPMCLLPVCGARRAPESRCSGSIGLDWHRRPCRAPNTVCRFKQFLLAWPVKDYQLL